MNEKTFWHRTQNERDEGQRGQSIVLIAFMLIGLLAFVGIAVDVGLVFARSSQLQAAVDSAALAAVTELAGGGLGAADTKAGQFLNANGVPLSVTLSLQSSTDTTILGERQYALTATWPVDLFFLKLIGRDQVDITRSATAAFFPLADIYVSRRVETGALSTSNQGVFGPNICIDYGDPFSPLNSPYEPGFYSYKYRILIPDDYPSDVLRVELFDPDSINQAQSNNFTVAHTQAAIDRGYLATENKSCSSTDRRQPCLIPTDETDLVDSNPDIELDQVNPWWFVRIDENRGAGSPPGDGSCGQPSPSYNAQFNTQTVYQLFYYRENPDGTIVRVDLASYTGQVGDGARDNGDHQTDMHWVSPGGTMIYDQLAPVPVDPGSAKTFELSISSDLPGVLTDPSTGNRYVYLDVSTVSGASENGFEVWAGPPDYVNSISSDVNVRNVQIINNPGSHRSRGATVFGLGRLPMNSNFGNPVEIPLIYVGPEYAGESIFVSLFDSDSGAQPPITFFFDTVAEEDWSMTFAQSGQDDPDGVADGVRCKPGSCGTQWVDPPYEIKVPGELDNCDPDNPTQEDCTPFYGGRLVARYAGGLHDTYGWQITLSGLPYLVK